MEINNMQEVLDQAESDDTKEMVELLNQAYADAVWECWKDLPNLVRVSEDTMRLLIRHQPLLPGAKKRIDSTRTGMYISSIDDIVADNTLSLNNARRIQEDMVGWGRLWAANHPDQLLFVRGPSLHMQRDGYTVSSYGWANTFYIELDPKHGVTA